MASLMALNGFGPRVFLCFLSSLGLPPLTSFFSREPPLPASNRVGTGSAPRFPHPSSATSRWTTFVILSSFLSFFLSFCPSGWLSGSPRLPERSCQHIYHIVYLPLGPVKLIPVSGFPFQSRKYPTFATSWKPRLGGRHHMAHGPGRAEQLGLLGASAPISGAASTEQVESTNGSPTERAPPTSASMPGCNLAHHSKIRSGKRRGETVFL